MKFSHYYPSLSSWLCLLFEVGDRLRSFCDRSANFLQSRILSHGKRSADIVQWCVPSQRYASIVLWRYCASDTNNEVLAIQYCPHCLLITHKETTEGQKTGAILTWVIGHESIEGLLMHDGGIVFVRPCLSWFPVIFGFYMSSLYAF